MIKSFMHHILDSGAQVARPVLTAWKQADFSELEARVAEEAAMAAKMAVHASFDAVRAGAAATSRAQVIVSEALKQTRKANFANLWTDGVAEELLQRPGATQAVANNETKPVDPDAPARIKSTMVIGRLAENRFLGVMRSVAFQLNLEIKFTLLRSGLVEKEYGWEVSGRHADVQKFILAMKEIMKQWS